jgi:hypothetical protein
MNDEPIDPPDSQAPSQESQPEQLYQSTDEPTTSPLPCTPKGQKPHEATPTDDQIRDIYPLPETETTEHLNPPAELPQQTHIPDPYVSSTDEYSDSESSDSEFEQPPDWDDMDPAQRHTWLRDHPSSKFVHTKLMNTEARFLTNTQRRKLLRLKKPKLSDSKPIDAKNREPSPTPNSDISPEQPTPISSPSHLVIRHKRDNDEETQVEQLTYKIPRHISTFQQTPTSLEPQQPRSPTPNEEDFNPHPARNICHKRQQQNDYTQDNKKQKCQEDVILLSTIEPPLPQPNTTIDSIPTPLDSLIQHPITPTLPQPFPQPETKEPTSNETAPDDPNQEYMATENHHESKPHSMPATEPPSEPPPHGIAASTSLLMTEPLLPQSETPMTPLDTVTSGFNPHAVPTYVPLPQEPENPTPAKQSQTRKRSIKKLSPDKRKKH